MPVCASAARTWPVTLTAERRMRLAVNLAAGRRTASAAPAIAMSTSSSLVHFLPSERAEIGARRPMNAASACWY
mgnify:CR=1 FL=1